MKCQQEKELKIEFVKEVLNLAGKLTKEDKFQNTCANFETYWFIL